MQQPTKLFSNLFFKLLQFLNSGRLNSFVFVYCLQTILKGEYLNKAKIAEGGKKLRFVCLSINVSINVSVFLCLFAYKTFKDYFYRKNWTSTWVVLCSNQLLFYKESKQEAVANLVRPHHTPTNRAAAPVFRLKNMSNR